MYRAAWVEGRNIGDADEIRTIVADAGLDAERMAEAIEHPEIKAELIEQTNQAVARGVFGAPTMFADGIMHFGQDRLPWIERALSEDGA